MANKFLLRSETKEFERRTPLTPADAKKLIESGSKVWVEKFADRIFSDEEYIQAGCELVDPESWQNFDEDVYILGLKELAEDNFPLRHKHIHFAHCYKGQDGAQAVLDRFKKGNGTLFDLEYLTNENGRRIAAFGYWAGFVGAAIAVKSFLHQAVDKNEKIPALHSYPKIDELLNEIKSLMAKTQERPSTIIIGAGGRCGSGAVGLLKELGLTATKWDSNETKKGGPFKEITEHDIFINAVLITTKIPPFIDMSIINKDSKLKIIADVSCDPNSDLNPIAVYNQHTTWEDPLLPINESLSVLAVDNLPSLLPRESSEDFSNQLLPYLIDLGKNDEESLVWKNALECFLKASN
jgi:saccharopine dehydrogenase (NAD+, L-lysine-forming)